MNSNKHTNPPILTHAFIRSSASPISQLPPFLLAAMTAGANGPRLDALLRQMSHSGGPPSKKPKVGKRLLKKTIRTFKNFPTLRRRDYSSSFSKVQMCAKSNPLKDKSAQWCRAKNPKFSSALSSSSSSSFLSTPHFFC